MWGTLEHIMQKWTKPITAAISRDNTASWKKHQRLVAVALSNDDKTFTMLMYI